jgi:protein involved in polysaccharide export with SLBB domain
MAADYINYCYIIYAFKGVMNKILVKFIASIVSLSIAFPSSAQMFGTGGGDDSLLGGMVPRAAATQAPMSPGIVGSSGLNINTVDRESAVKQTVVTPAADSKPADPSEFQKYVSSVAGGPVPYFGANFFASTPTSFAPMQNIPVPSDYAYGPGDEVLIRAWGGVNIDYRAVVDRNGVITIPTVGTVPLIGVKASQAEGIVRNAIGKGFSNFQVSVSPGQIRAIRIYVVGQAQKPGTYTVSSLSTLVTALFVTGGPSARGSLRNVELKRAGKVVANIDMYAFLAKGDKSQDVPLLEGDTIFIPPAFGNVAIIGKLEAPAIYELKDANESIGSLLSLTGGLPIVADPLLATLQRIDPIKRPAAFFVNVKLDTEGQKQKLANGDILTVLPISTGVPIAKRNVYVRIDGEVQKPGLYEVRNGQTTQDLIAMAGGLTPQAYVYATSFFREATRVQQTEAFKRLIVRLEATLKTQAGTMAASQGASSDAALLAQRNQAALAAAEGQLARLKTIVPEGRIALQINPRIDDADAIPDLLLEPGDRLVIPARNDFVQVYGAVNIESSLIHRPNRTVADYLRVAGLQRDADTSSIFVLRADGLVDSDEGGFFSSGIAGSAIYAGDVIVVPQKLDRETKYAAFMRGLKDWSQIMGQLGLAAAAIKVLSQ